MPASMTGVPPQIAAVTEKKMARASAEIEFQSRQRAYREKEESWKQMDKDLRRLYIDKQNRRMDYDPGLGPTRWLWPTAHQHPRTWSKPRLPRLPHVPSSRLHIAAHMNMHVQGTVAPCCALLAVELTMAFPVRAFSAHGGDILLEREPVMHRHGGPGYTQGLPSPTRFGYVPGSPRSAYNSPQ